MKKYNFLFKPLFFIFNLLLATWLVLEIEKIKPSDFSKRPSFFKNKTALVCDTCSLVRFQTDKKQQPFALKAHHLSLKKLSADYKCGLIDSIGLDQELENILQSLEQNTPK